MMNPFLKTINDLANQNRKAKEIQDKINEISQPYFYREVRKIEHPSIDVKITKAIEQQTKKQTESSNFISKLLANRKQLTERALMMNEDADALSTNRTTPALIDYEDLGFNKYIMPEDDDISKYIMPVVKSSDIIKDIKKRSRKQSRKRPRKQSRKQITTNEFANMLNKEPPVSSESEENSNYYEFPKNIVSL